MAGGTRQDAQHLKQRHVYCVSTAAIRTCAAVVEAAFELTCCSISSSVSTARQSPLSCLAPGFSVLRRYSGPVRTPEPGSGRPGIHWCLCCCLGVATAPVALEQAVVVDVGGGGGGGVTAAVYYCLVAACQPEIMHGIRQLEAYMLRVHEFDLLAAVQVVAGFLCKQHNASSAVVSLQLAAFLLHTCCSLHAPGHVHS